ncbi:MAG TPA: DUF1990 family protein [Longimicrobiales bacterium]
MAEWRFARGWSDAELEDRLARLGAAERNFDPRAIRPGEGWVFYYSEAPIGRGEPGPPAPGDVFERAKAAIVDYAFSDPRIVTAHFDPAAPLLGRRMLLEIRVLGLRYLCGVVVGAVRSLSPAGRTVFGFRYETLHGHIESGFEWFLLTADHEAGETWFRIQATWRPGQLPNWWSRVGFRLLARRFQRAWHRLAYVRLRQIVGAKGLAPVPRGRRLLHEGPALANPGIWAMSAEDVPAPARRPEREAEGAERRWVERTHGDRA